MTLLRSGRLAASAVAAVAGLLVWANGDAQTAGGTILVADTVATDPLKPIEVGAGQVFLIALPRNPGTGYAWRVSTAPNPNVVTMTGSSFLAGKTGTMGAPGQQIFVYQTHSPGNATISLDDVAPGRDATVAKTVHFKVVVKKS
jgi:predicted secreted protein